MKTRKAISTLRTLREFTPEKVDRKTLKRIVQAGDRTPGLEDARPRSFVVILDREQLTELATVGALSGHIGRAAAAIAIVTDDVAEGWIREMIAFDVGRVAQNMMLAAWDLGIGSADVAVYDPALAQHVLGYPDGYRCDHIVSFGYPAPKSKSTQRASLPGVGLGSGTPGSGEDRVEPPQDVV